MLNAVCKPMRWQNQQSRYHPSFHPSFHSSSRTYSYSRLLYLFFAFIALVLLIQLSQLRYADTPIEQYYSSPDGLISKGKSSKKEQSSLEASRVPSDTNFRTLPALKTLQKQSSASGQQVEQGELSAATATHSSADLTSLAISNRLAIFNDKAEFLPDIIHIPFEDAVSDEVLVGWEDEWVAHGELDAAKWGRFMEPKIDFVYLWVNGSEETFTDTISPFELSSPLNKPDGEWLHSHRKNRYRDWDELRYSVRSIEKNAGSFRNQIQLLVNPVNNSKSGKQAPSWLNDKPSTKDAVRVLSQEEFFDKDKQECLPTFNSLTIENQIFNTPSDVDRMVAMSDDMLLGKQHAASDFFSPLFGTTMSFKTNAYNTINPPSDADAKRFGEKPFLIYTSWLLNRRFGERKRKGQAHFGHSLSRSVTREAVSSFPGPEMMSACQRFRGESKFQLYSWYATFHYTIERHREALLWSYLMLRSDVDKDGNLSWKERQAIMADLEEGMSHEGATSYRTRNFYHVAQALEEVGLEAPKVNTDIAWTSLDGPATIMDIECLEFNVDECLAPGFSTQSSDKQYKNPVFSSAAILDRVARQEPTCGDCLIKLLLNRVQKGLSPLLPHADSQSKDRETVIKALIRYQYNIVNPDALFVMVTDAEQIDNVVFKRYVQEKKQVGQLCLNDDVITEDEEELEDLKEVMQKLYQGMFPEKSSFE